MKINYSISLVLLVFPALVCGAQADTDIQRGIAESIRLQQLQEQQLNIERQGQQLNRPKSNIEFTAPEIKQSEAGGVCRDIKIIQFEGTSLLSPDKKVELSKPYLGTCMSINDIEKLLSDLTNFYIAKGFISARVYVQPQDLAAGILKLLVLEGKVERLILEDGKKNDTVNLSTAFPFMTGNLLNLRDIEQGLDQINRLASNAATMKIAPGNEAGQSVVLIQNQTTRRLRSNLTYDTFGSTSTGVGQAGLNISIDNLLGLNDFLNITHRRTAEGPLEIRNSSSNSLMYSLPVGGLNLTASHSKSEYLTTINLIGGQLVVNGKSYNTSLFADYVIYRDKTNRLALTGGFAKKESENYLAGQLLGVSSRVLSTFDLGGRWSTQLFGGALSINLGNTKGLKRFGAMVDPVGLPDIAPRAQFRKTVGGISWFKGFQFGKKDFVYSTTLNGQVGQDVLYGQEQFAIGSIFSVRGYRNTSIIGDTGYFWRNDLAMPLQFLLNDKPLTFKPFIGYDVGIISDSNTGMGGRLTGMAVGFNVVVNRFNFEVSGVKPLEMPSRLRNEGFQLFTKLNLNF